MLERKKRVEHINIAKHLKYTSIHQLLVYFSNLKHWVNMGSVIEHRDML